MTKLNKKIIKQNNITDDDENKTFEPKFHAFYSINYNKTYLRIVKILKTLLTNSLIISTQEKIHKTLSGHYSYLTFPFPLQ